MAKLQISGSNGLHLTASNGYNNCSGRGYLTDRQTAEFTFLSPVGVTVTRDSVVGMKHSVKKGCRFHR
jgi:hypothetical protein